MMNFTHQGFTHDANTALLIAENGRSSIIKPVPFLFVFRYFKKHSFHPYQKTYTLLLTDIAKIAVENQEIFETTSICNEIPFSNDTRPSICLHNTVLNKS